MLSGSKKAGGTEFDFQFSSEMNEPAALDNCVGNTQARSYVCAWQDAGTLDYGSAVNFTFTFDSRAGGYHTTCFDARACAQETRSQDPNRRMHARRLANPHAGLDLGSDGPRVASACEYVLRQLAVIASRGEPVHEAGEFKGCRARRQG
jgi:hypothetical protein